MQATKDQIFQDLQDAGLVEEEDINEAGITLNIPADTVELDFTPNLAFLSEQDDSVAAEIGGCDDIPWADFLGTRLGTRAYNACLPTSSDNGATLMQSFLNNLPIVMFLCVPLLAVSMKFLYVFKRRKYVEHLMFLFHTHSFIFALVILNIIFVRLSNNYAGVHNLLPWLVTGIWIYAVIYVFLALRRVYKQGRFMTSFKMLLLVPCYPICIAMAFVLVLLFTLITF